MFSGFCERVLDDSKHRGAQLVNNILTIIELFAYCFHPYYLKELLYTIIEYGKLSQDSFNFINKVSSSHDIKRPKYQNNFNLFCPYENFYRSIVV